MRLSFIAMMRIKKMRSGVDYKTPVFNSDVCNVSYDISISPLTRKSKIEKDTIKISNTRIKWPEIENDIKEKKDLGVRVEYKENNLIIVLIVILLLTRVRFL